MLNKKQKPSGFTIVELLVVIVVIGILAAITIVSYTGISGRAIVASLQSDLVSASQQLKIYQTLNNAYPTLINDCPTPAAANICLKSSNGNSFTAYTPNNGVSPQTFSLTSVNTNGVSYFITNDSTPVTTVAPVNLTFNNTSTGRSGTIQSWTVPATDTYTIEAWGAQGGGSGGLGARMRGDFTLTVGAVIKILVGQQGVAATYNGGGGGTFVTTSANSPLIIAGGGGGYNVSGGGSLPGVLATSGSASSNGVAGGTSGNGGGGGFGAGGGGGLLTNGGVGLSAGNNNPGQSFISGGLGALATAPANSGDGGFGGGGNGDGQYCGEGGAGGGYSGGGGGVSVCGQGIGGGGGSYNSGTNPSNSSGVRSGQGLVTIHN